MISPTRRDQGKLAAYRTPAGEFINGVYLKLYGINHRKVADLLDIAPSTLGRLIKADAGVTPGMALRLSKTLGRSPEICLTIQPNYEKKQILEKAAQRF